MKRFCYLIICWGYMIHVNAQNVGIGTTNPDASARLDVVDSNRGLLIPRVALTKTNDQGPVTNPATSLLVYNTATANDVWPGFYYWDGTKWVRLDTGNGDWKLDGNSNGAERYIGTNDNFDFPIHTNGTEKMRVTTGGSVGIGTTSPTQRLHVAGGSVLTDRAYAATTLNLAAANAINITQPATQVRITNVAGNQANAVTYSAAAIEGQYLWISNTDDDAATFAGATIPSNTAVGFVYTGGAWRAVRALGAGDDWTILGNAGTNETSNFIGTTDAQGLTVRTNNLERFRFSGSAYQLLSMGNGTAGAPAYSFNSENNSGMYRSGAGSLSLSTGGGERLRVTNTPQVLSGTQGTAASPAWSFTAATGTGIYAPLTTALGFSANGTERFRITSGNQMISMGNGTAGEPNYTWNTSTNTGFFMPASGQIGVTAAGNYVVNIGAQSQSFGFNRVPTGSRLGGIRFFDIYSPCEIGNDAGGNPGYQATLGYWRGADVEVSPERDWYGYVGYLGGSNANPAWYRMYSYGFINASRRELKTGIVPVNTSSALMARVIEDIKKIQPSFYHYTNEKTIFDGKFSTKYRPHYHLGVIVDESPDYILDEAFSGVDGYGLAALSLAGTKYCIEQLEYTTVQDFGSLTFSGTSMDVTFDSKFSNKIQGNIPVVNLTMQDFTDAQLIITNKSDKGFTIKSNKPLNAVKLDWIAFGKVSLKSDGLPSIIEENRLKVPDSHRKEIQNYFFNLKATEKMRLE